MTDTEATALARFCGLAVDYAEVHDDRIVINYGGGLTFEKLAKVSEKFGTTKIDLGIDHGCASDPSVDPYIIVWIERKP